VEVENTWEFPQGLPDEVGLINLRVRLAPK
jgi:hypothetical protein